MKDKEKNRIKLKKGLQGLPQHQPPADLWNKIEFGMEQGERDEVLQAALAKLPQYDPPEMVWENINDSLSQGKVRQLRSRRLTNWLSAASVSLVLGLGGWWLLGSNQFSEETTVSFSYAQIETQLLERSQDEAGEMIDRVIAEIQQVPHTWKAPKTVALRNSLDQIRTSIDQFKTTGDKYGMNLRMHEQLTDMYNKRNKIVRALATMI